MSGTQTIRFRQRGTLMTPRSLREKHGLSTFHEALLSWRRSGFSADASQRTGAGEEARLERLARYATRVTLAVGADD